MKPFPWRVCVFVLLALAASGSRVYPAPTPPDPLVGDWLYWHDHPVAFNADGTAIWKGQGGFAGTWEYLHNPEVQRHYRIIWKQGQTIDNLVLAEDGQHAHVAKQMGSYTQNEQYDVRRAIADKPAAANPFGAGADPASVAAPVNPHDPLVGDWRWSNGHPAVFHADGTARVGGLQGTWQYSSGPGPGRTYRMNWGHGKYLETFVCAPDSQSGTIMKDGETPIEVHRVASSNPPAAPAPATGAVIPSVAVGTASVAVAGPADPADPILGSWTWRDNPTTFKADGTIKAQTGRQGVWQYLHNPGAARQYLVTWGRKGYTDALTFTPGADSIHVVHVSEAGRPDEKGAQYELPRADPAAPAASAPAVNPFGASGH